MGHHGVVSGLIRSVNIGHADPTTHSTVGVSGIDKYPTSEPVDVAEPGPRGTGASGVAGDSVCDLKHHGGTHQAVYAVAREDLDVWQDELDRPLRDGTFGENVTTLGLDLTNMVVGSVWRVGTLGLRLQVTAPRIPCRTFAGHMGEQGWVRRFTQRGATGAYLMVVDPGPMQAGDTIEIESVPDHGITLEYMFRASTTQRSLLPQLQVLDPIHPSVSKDIDAYLARHG